MYHGDLEWPWTSQACLCVLFVVIYLRLLSTLWINQLYIRETKQLGVTATNERDSQVLSTLTTNKYLRCMTAMRVWNDLEWPACRNDLPASVRTFSMYLVFRWPLKCCSSHINTYRLSLRGYRRVTALYSWLYCNCKTTIIIASKCVNAISRSVK